MAERKPFLLRIDPELWAELEAWAQDELRSVNGQTPRTWPEFRQIVGRAQIGDTLRFVVQPPNSAQRTASVIVTGYDRPVVRIATLTAATEKQRRLREAWMSARP